MLKKLILATSAALVLVPAVQAGHDNYPRRPALAELAHELEATTRRAHVVAERNLNPHRPRSRAAMRDLHRLEQRARSFHRTVEHRKTDRFRMQRDFDLLLDSFARASYSVEPVRSRYVRQEFYRAGRLIDRVSAVLDTRHRDRRYDRGGRWDRHDRRGPDDRRASGGSVVFGDRRGDVGYEVRVRW